MDHTVSSPDESTLRTPQNPNEPTQPQAAQPRKSQPSMAVVAGWIFLALLVIAISGAAWFQQLRKKQVAPPPPVISHVEAPTFIDETGTTFPLTNLDGRIWVVDFIFTRCGGQCPLMTMNMRNLQNWLVENHYGNVKLVSITVDPENDTPPVLAKYAKTFGAISGKWHFLTGDRKTIYDYILNDFKLATEEEKSKPVSEMFVHSDKLVLIDENRNIRGYYSGSEPSNTDSEDLKKLKDAIESLSHESSDLP